MSLSRLGRHGVPVVGLVDIDSSQEISSQTVPEGFYVQAALGSGLCCSVCGQAIPAAADPKTTLPWQGRFCSLVCQRQYRVSGYETGTPAFLLAMVRAGINDQLL